MTDDLKTLRIDRAEKAGQPGRRGARRFTWLAVFLAVAALALFLYKAFPLRQEVLTATVSKVFPSQSVTLLNASGYVVAERKSALAAKITGRLVWRGVEEGSRVKAGEVVARLESDDVNAALNRAKVDVDTAAASMAVARAEFEDADLDFRRKRELQAKGVIASSDYDTARARHDKAKASLDVARFTLESSRAGRVQAEVNVEYTLIRAPFDAVVLTKTADIGDIVTPLGAAANAKASVVSIADLSSLQVEADVSESNIAKVSAGGPCEIQLDSLPETRFEGLVHMIVPTADRSKATVMVKVRFKALDPRILPEMSAKVAFLERPLGDEEKTPRIAAPKSAVREKDGRSFVFHVKDGVALEREVRKGQVLGPMQELLEGAALGDKLVVDPPAGLKDRDAVKILEK